MPLVALLVMSLLFLAVVECCNTLDMHPVATVALLGFAYFITSAFFIFLVIG